MRVKPSVIVSVIAVVLAIAAGVAIAGLPSDAPGSDLVITEMPPIETRPVPTVAPLEVEPLGTTTTAATETSVPETTTASTDPADSTTSTTSTTMGPPTTSAFLDAETTTSTTAPVTNDQLRERATLSVATANATAVAGIATAHAEELQGFGYVGVSPVDSTPQAESRVYYQPGFDLEASRMADELGWGLLATAPAAELPALTTDATFDLVAVIGFDDT